MPFDAAPDHPALAVGYHEAVASGALGAHFGQLWHNRQADDAVGPVSVLPDGCVDLLFRDGQLFVVGPDIVAAHPELAAGSVVLGARFLPGAAQDWLGMPMDAIVGQAVALEDVLGGWAREASMRILDAGDAVAQRALFARLLAGRAPHHDDGLRQRAAHVFRRMGDGADSVAQVAATLEISPRSLQRLCNARFGYGAKTLARVLRLQRLLALGRSRPALPLIALALHAGYTDQAHMGHDVRELAHTTPSALLRRQTG